MKLANLAVGSCAALALAAMALDTQAGRGRGGGGGRSHAAAGGTGGHHHHHAQSHVFVGASFVSWPRAYYWPGYYPYAPAVAAPVAQYWYYCTAAAAYYPYVQDCPGGWELVLPTMPPHPGY